ncbi:hypothetical protein LTR62_003147 [Meristemomyces frigidus]|uniref:Nudix hydrolase domain-containing protein n=1 Tax=Meristemomyces frigidus TaxID=1508187 RepID=A0AAN7TA46_9PEZI|nr:hypothetical protein LTR62_003147 [Meristemomyces frigidus]
MPTSPSLPVSAAFPASHLTIGAGVAIFHLASSRVVLCYHTRDKYWFLPKGRRNANEETGRAAEREGFEESGFRNRLLPIPVRHRQPTDPDQGFERFVVEPVWTLLAPVGGRGQYILHWYVAETVPRVVEASYAAAGQASDQSGGASRIYEAPAPFPKDLSLRGRIAMDVVVGADGLGRLYEPYRHEGTGVDEEEMLYTSELLSIEDARRKMRGSVMADVVQVGWEAIQLRFEIEGG